MKVIDIIELNKNLLDSLNKNNVSMNDLRYFEAYKEFTELRKQYKFEYCLNVILKKYDIKRFSFLDRKKKFDKDFNY